MDGADRAVAPAADEFEVSLIGPGFGETVLVHMGGGDWFVVDSCTEREGGPLGLQYLKQIGVNLQKQVKLVVASHWDDDHIRGLAQVLRECSKARFALSRAYTTKDFLSILRAFEPGSFRRRSGVREFWEIYEFLQREKRFARHAAVDRGLWEQNRGPFPCRVTALSPSEADEAAALEDFRRSFVEAVENGTREFFSTIRPNASSVVIWAVVGDVRILLGADLEVEANPYRGWTAVIASDAWGGERASVFKIPHHGSADAQSDDAWNSMLLEHPVALTSPFIRGRHRIPSATEREAIRQRTTRGYLARDPEAGVSGLTAISKQTFGEATRQVVVVDAPPGHVRARGSLKDPAAWRVELFGDAVPV